MKKIYFYDPSNGEYLREETLGVLKAQSLAIKANVYEEMPKNATDITPIADVGNCWFYNGKWNKKPKSKRS